MNLAAIPWGALLCESALVFLLLVGLGLGLVGVWSLWSHGFR
jgi:hypothetical protein